MKKWVAGSIIVLSLGFGASALADGAFNILVNGKAFDGNGKARVENGTTMVPAKQLAEALGATVKWDASTQTVTITKQENTADQQRLALLEGALAANSAEQAAKSWGEAVKQRNGAWQFALFAPSLQAVLREDFESHHWVTGTSSPWVESYKVGDATENTNGTVSIDVAFTLTDSTKTKSTQTQTLTLKKTQSKWMITEFKTTGDGVEPGSEFPYITYENQYRAYTVTLPKEWYGKYTVVETDGKADFVFRSEDEDMKASIVTICDVAAADWKQDELGQLHKLAEKDGRVYYYVLPLDNPFTGKEVQEYGSMVQQARKAMSTFSLPE